MGRPKYLSTNEMVTGLEKKTNLPLPEQQQATSPVTGGDFRIYRPTKYDVLCGRGAPIQNHDGNIRMRRIVSKYTRRYMESRKYRKQFIAEEAVQKVKTADSGKIQARFLRRVGRENYWEEVDDKITCDKVSHSLRCFVRKLEDGGTISDASDGLDDEEGVADDETDEEASDSSAAEANGSSSVAIPRSLQEANAAGIQALQISNERLPTAMRMLPYHSDPLFSSHPSMMSGFAGFPGVNSRFPASSAMLPSMLGSIPGARNTVPRSAAEAELDYRMSLHAISTRRLMDMVAVERAQRFMLPPPASLLASNHAALASARMEQSCLLQERLLTTRARMKELMEKNTPAKKERGDKQLKEGTKDQTSISASCSTATI